MATYHQYSEIVAAYGPRVPPPSRPQNTRLALPLLYAAVGAILGTFTGTVAGVVSLQPQPIASHLHFAGFRSSGTKIHAIANASQSPVIQNHAAQSAASMTKPPVVQIPAASPMAASAPLPAVQAAHADLPPAISTHTANQSARLTPPAIVEHHRATRTAHTLSTQLIQPEPVKLFAVAPLPVQPVIATNANQSKAPAVHQQALAGNVILVPATARQVRPQPSTSLSTTTDAAAAATLSLDDTVKAQMFYSEGDATVISYNAAGDTLQTDDGRTFAVGATVSVSSATSWQDYHANVHYRCDQGGHCTLTRTGVIALNARLI